MKIAVFLARHYPWLKRPKGPYSQLTFPTFALISDYFGPVVLSNPASSWAALDLFLLLGISVHLPRTKPHSCLCLHVNHVSTGIGVGYQEM